MTADTTPPLESGADEFRLPEVAGRRIATSNAEFERKCLVYLYHEQRKILPDNAVIALFCEAVRLTREYNDHVADDLKSNGEQLHRTISDNEKIRSLETRLSESEAARLKAGRDLEEAERGKLKAEEVLKNCLALLDKENFLDMGHWEECEALSGEHGDDEADSPGEFLENCECSVKPIHEIYGMIKATLPPPSTGGK
jgi:hypothetical protein